MPPIEHPPPTEATVKYLYAHAFRCAYEGCRRPLYRLDEQTGVKTLNSRVCHINARREGGPRWDANQSDEDNRTEKNLVLMCVEHASTIDDSVTLSAYPAERLREWKATQLQEYERLSQGWVIDAAMANEIIRASFSDLAIEAINSTLKLGGEGGKAPGAGGGGGGAIGRGARAGRGGDGGDQRIENGEYTLPWKEDELVPAKAPDLDFIPGAGGGGAGAVGEGVVAGNGGGGGESVAGLIDLVELRKVGLDRIQVVVGQGGTGSHLPGQHGNDGEDTVVHFLAKDETILKTLRATGGRGGKSGTSYLPEGVAEISAEDINGSFGITMLMPVRAAELRDGLLFILGGGWIRFEVPELPIEAIWSVACTARWRTFEGTTPRGMFLSLMHPDGHEAASQALVVPADSTTSGCYHWISRVGANLDAEGTWVLRVHSGGFLLAKFDVDLAVMR